MVRPPVRVSAEQDIPQDNYHHGRTVKRDQSGKGRPERTVNHEYRPFIAWDGEGINIDGVGRPQKYVLFGSTVGSVEARDGLTCFDCVDHIVETGREHPSAIHVGFAFGYDTNMIVASLAPVSLQTLHRNGWVRVKARGYTYVLTWAKGKWFQVTRYNDNVPRMTVRIFDIFAFFQTSAINAWKGVGIDVPSWVVEGKAARKSFTLEQLDSGEVRRYWETEIQLYRQLAEELRKRVYNAGLRITQWYGPGALASYKLRQVGIKQHMRQAPEEVRLASRYAYAGGRFELFKMGRITGPIYGIDINSAYPHAITQLPSLVDGEWRHVENPTRIRRFGVYRVELQRGRGFERSPGVVFHRDKDHNISFPWRVHGWYWDPEAYHALRCGGRVVEGWEYVGSTDRPFGWVQDMYDQRRDWKRRGISAQLALKLCLNSMYGKMAQRVGYNTETRRLPPFHQLEWAGWITSYVRARLWEVMALRIPKGHLIAVETDGIYTTYDPALMGIQHSDELGGWSVSQYDEIMYVQSGLAWMRQGTQWTDKRRGLDDGTFTREQCEYYLRMLHARPSGKHPWPVYIGQSTRFVTLGRALAASVPTHQLHCVWATDPRDINPSGQGGKRFHVWRECDACNDNLSAYDAGHDLVINSVAMGIDPRSYPHSIPWEQEIGRAWWRTAEHHSDSVIAEEMVW